jgi:glutathione S-transferase
VHPTFTRIFRTYQFADSDVARADVKALAVRRYRECLERIQGWVEKASPYWLGERITFHDAYAFTLLRWGGIAGIDPQSLPAYRAYIERVIAAAPVAAALERERIRLDTRRGIP